MEEIFGMEPGTVAVFVCILAVLGVFSFFALAALKQRRAERQWHAQLAQSERSAAWDKAEQDREEREREEHESVGTREADAVNGRCPRGRAKPRRHLRVVRDNEGEDSE
ncbi:hypothetical protein HQ524_00235 [Candidatus Uhrbacteria bacterium]|nr:hypothetical protein [Candidatus Uhrbacteria bacterium]